MLIREMLWRIFSLRNHINSATLVWEVNQFTIQVYMVGNPILKERILLHNILVILYHYKPDQNQIKVKGPKIQHSNLLSEYHYVSSENSEPSRDICKDNNSSNSTYQLYGLYQWFIWLLLCLVLFEKPPPPTPPGVVDRCCPHRFVYMGENIQSYWTHGSRKMSKPSQVSNITPSKTSKIIK